MQLNVYLISHPIINKLSSEIIYSTEKKNNRSTYLHSQLNLFLIYEVMRKWISIHNIYIKNIDCTKEISIFEPKESFLMMTNLEDCSSIITNIQTIIPKLKLIHTCLNKKTKRYINISDDYLDSPSITIMKKQKIIVMEKLLNDYSIIQLLDYLILDKQINTNAMKIICIACTNNILEVINNKYPTLEIYTTKIIN